jgi:hypothetical protein
MKGHKMHGMHGEHHAHGGHVHHMVKKHSMHSMKRAAHKKGGAVESPMHGDVDEDPTPNDVYSGGNSPTVHQAKEKHASRKRGGRTMHHGKHVEMHGHHAHHRLDRPARKSGGKVGGAAEMHPFSSAHNVKTPAGRMVEPGES